MKLHTRWKRVRDINILNHRFFDAGEYGLGYFTVLRAYKCKEFSCCAENRDGSHWFTKAMLVIKTDKGLKYKVPFCPYLEIYDDTGDKSFSDYYNAQPWMN